MGLMRAVFYRAEDGSEPVDDFIDDLDATRQVAIDNKIKMLNRLREEDPPLAFPHSSQVEGELRELRCHYGNELYRILYRRSRNLFILLEIFRKTTGDVPEANKQIARDRWTDFERRMNAEPRQAPRAGGHDAPPDHR